MGVDVKVALKEARALQAEGLVEQSRRAFASVMNDPEHRVAGFIGFIQCDALLSGREKALERGQSLIELWDLAGEDVGRARRYLEGLRSPRDSGPSEPSEPSSGSSSNDEVVELDLIDIDLLDDTASIALAGPTARPRSLREETKQTPVGTSQGGARLLRTETRPQAEDAAVGAQILSLFGPRHEDRDEDEDQDQDEESPASVDAGGLDGGGSSDVHEPSVECTAASGIVAGEVLDPSARPERPERPVRVTTRRGRLSLRSGLARGSGERSSDDDKDFSF